jgi:hypothetical protein
MIQNAPGRETTETLEKLAIMDSQITCSSNRVASNVQARKFF